MFFGRWRLYFLLFITTFFTHLQISSADCPTTQKSCQGQCYDPSSYICYSNVQLCAVGEGICNGACYDASSYKCYGTVLCPNETQVCGTTCFDPTLYYCQSSTLLQGTAPTSTQPSHTTLAISSTSTLTSDTTTATALVSSSSVNSPSPSFTSSSISVIHTLQTSTQILSSALTTNLPTSSISSTSTSSIDSQPTLNYTDPSSITASPSSNSIQKGVIAGIVIACLVAVIIPLFCLYKLLQRRNRRRQFPIGPSTSTISFIANGFRGLRITSSVEDFFSMVKNQNHHNRTGDDSEKSGRRDSQTLPEYDVKAPVDNPSKLERMSQTSVEFSSQVLEWMQLRDSLTEPRIEVRDGLR